MARPSNPAKIYFKLAWILVTLSLSIFTSVFTPTDSLHGNDSAKKWLEVEIGIIGTASTTILEDVQKKAAAEQYDGILIKLDTPGGSLESTRTMVKSMMASPIPIVVWVGPSGAHAGSAGAFITIASHVAAMAPGTNIGAAHPIQGSGKDIDNEELNRKVMNDTLAFIESIATERGRNVEMARSFVATSVSITADEALEHKVIDLIASDSKELMEQLDGKIVTMQNGNKLTLSTHNIAITTHEKTFQQKMLEILSNPNLFYLLFMGGLMGLGYELTHPGAYFPGIAGGICLILALMASSVLPVSWAAAALILLGIGLLVAEAFVPSFGILGIGGLVALFFGSVFLVDPSNEQGLRISWSAIAPAVLTTGGLFALIGYLVVKAERAPVQSGLGTLIGETVTVVSDFNNGHGQVFAQGAVWQGITEAEDLKKDESVIVKDVKELTVFVERK